MAKVSKKIARAVKGRKIAIFDIEASNLAADLGVCIAAVVKYVGEEPRVWDIHKTPGYGTTPRSLLNDRDLVVSLRDALEEADVVVAHYGKKFDIPFIQTRLLAWGERPMAALPLIDTWRVARTHLRLNRNSLALVGTALECENKKPQVAMRTFHLAAIGDKPSQKIVVDRCIGDVLLLEEMYLKLLPVITTHPYIGPLVSNDDADRECPNCGSTKTNRHGYRRTKNFQITRMLCSTCGTAYQGKRSKVR